MQVVQGKGDGNPEGKAARAGWEPHSECRGGEGMSVLLDLGQAQEVQRKRQRSVHVFR